MDNDKTRIVRILENTNLCFLFGAGTSVVKEENILSFPLMADLIETVKNDDNVISFYSYLKEQSSDEADHYCIIKSIFDHYLFAEDANIEKFLSMLESSEQFIVNQTFRNEVINSCVQIKQCVRERITQSEISNILPVYKNFYKAIHHLKEISSSEKQCADVFTTNYDMLNELALEDLGIHYYSGFYGIARRKFNLAFYDHEFVNVHKIKGANYIVDSDHINLYKLHGSLSWFYDTECNELIEMNPFKNDFEPEIIYPASTKFQKTNSIVYYSSLMREFSDKICSENTTLVVIGNSLSDEHINKMIENALSINTFTLIIFGYDENKIKTLKEKYNRYNNVIVYPEGQTLLTLSELILNLGMRNDE